MCFIRGTSRNFSECGLAGFWRRTGAWSWMCYIACVQCTLHVYSAHCIVQCTLHVYIAHCMCTVHTACVQCTLHVYSAHWLNNITVDVWDYCLASSDLKRQNILQNIYIYIYTGCPRRKGQNFGRVFPMLKYTDITQNTYIQS